ncbi:hypothetical protein ACFGVS_03355 [Mucilaginibacter sp. AW1-7]|uniref:hypothetical protein n=1 Tax=Mucilaginibacter sp. AW1-7 TaxID=3349874 RepID=UPI003F73E5E6
MNRFQQWFNQLKPAQQKTALVLFCLLFACLLILSIRYQQTNMNTGNIVQPRLKTDTLKHR